tara:strand:- start:8749 stop:8937 length:189 start_codon:yes stop_codon:yes gene_type:complete
VQVLKGESYWYTYDLAKIRRIADHVPMCSVSPGCGFIIESGDALTVLDKSLHPITQAFAKVK